MRVLSTLVFVLGFSVLGACSEEGTESSSSSSDGGSSNSGGTASGGAVGGGASGGSSGSGGVVASGGVGTGGGASGGADPTGGSGGDVGSGGGADTGGASTGGANGTLGDLPTPDCGAPADLGVRIVGRHDGCTAGAVRYSWSGAGFVARFEGTGLRFTQSGNSVEYTIVVDGVVQPKLVTTSGESTYEAASGLDAAEHTVEVYRRGEASFGATTLLGVEAVGGQLLSPPPHPGRRIEIFGDSITCGYGNEGMEPSCGFSADTENHYLTYGAELARRFGAELSTVAWSGKGVVVNYGGDMGTTLTEMLDRAEPNSATSVWDYRLAPAADLVILNLGTNDYSTDNDPASPDFQTTYEGMLMTLRARYPEAYILCTLGPLLSGADLDTARMNIVAAVAARSAAGDDRVSTYEMAPENPSPGCDWHPSLATHQAMADELEPVVAAALGW